MHGVESQSTRAHDQASDGLPQSSRSFRGAARAERIKSYQAVGLLATGASAILYLGSTEARGRQWV
jgi:hypothetical protein